jgi:hypothetical protein
VPSSDVYRTALGTIIRITESAEGGLKVEILKDNTWTPGRIGMVGLRLRRSTTKLSPNAILGLPV